VSLADRSVRSGDRESLAKGMLQNGSCLKKVPDRPEPFSRVLGKPDTGRISPKEIERINYRFVSGYNGQFSDWCCV
jgi:hypothetical protein